MSNRSYNGKTQNFPIFQVSGEKLRICIKNPKYTKVTGNFFIFHFISFGKIPSRDFFENLKKVTDSVHETYNNKPTLKVQSYLKYSKFDSYLYLITIHMGPRSGKDCIYKITFKIRKEKLYLNHFHL